jgi:NADPH:quinone reductase-like Zn-dependent oxidoreductase
MEAFVLERYGHKADLHLRNVPEPEVGPHDVLVKVHAASVNPLDTKIRAGLLRLVLPYRLPFVLGHDVAGLVVGVGSAVRSFTPGDEVFARPDDGRIGTFAEFIAVPEDDLALKPSALTMEEAASLPLVALTAWQALVDVAKVQPGQRVLVHAGSGGVGTIAIQLAKHLGAHVATTTGTANVEWVRALGADAVVDYRREDFSSVLCDYDVVLDGQGGRTLRKSLGVLRPGGIAIGINWPPDPAFVRDVGAHPLIQAATALLSAPTRLTALRHRVRYSYLVMRANGNQLRAIAALVDQGAITPVLDKIFTFSETNAAMDHVHSGRAKGKVVVTLGLPPNTTSKTRKTSLPASPPKIARKVTR